jgi:MFS transporter, DHA3 family, macrolide efflux protein
MDYVPPPHGFRTFVIMWTAQSLSVIGSGMTGFALNVYLVQVLYPEPEQKPALALALTVLNLAFVIPFVFGAPLAGAWADRHDRRQTMIMTDAVKGVLALLPLFLMVSAGLELWMLVVIGFLGAAAAAFHFSAFDSSYAMLVPDRLLPRANGMMQTTGSVSGIISPALAATILALPGLAAQGIIPFAPLAVITNPVSLVIAVDAVTFFFAALVLLFLDVPSPVRADRGSGGKIAQGVLADIREGAKMRECEIRTG